MGLLLTGYIDKLQIAKFFGIQLKSTDVRSFYFVEWLIICFQVKFKANLGK